MSHDCGTSDCALKKHIGTGSNATPAGLPGTGTPVRFIVFHQKRHPREMGSEEITAFLTHLAVDGGVAAATQNQAFNALLFLYRQVLKLEMPDIKDVVRARQSRRLPVVLTREETEAVLARLSHANRLLVSLLYGAGLRLMEAVRLQGC